MRALINEDNWLKHRDLRRIGDGPTRNDIGARSLQLAMGPYEREMSRVCSEFAFIRLQLILIGFWDRTDLDYRQLWTDALRAAKARASACDQVGWVWGELTRDGEPEKPSVKTACTKPKGHSGCHASAEGEWLF